MTQTIFLDVGANTGQTLQAVRDQRFDTVVCFEPSRVCWPKLTAMAETMLPSCSVQLEYFGLWNKTCEAVLIEPGRAGASLWKKDKSIRDTTELCQFRCASEWFAAHLTGDETVFMKLNCEGAECDILDDLLDSGEFAKVAYTLICFDVHKIASQKHREA